MLQFNIGPSFLHMIFYNNFTGRSFNYLFDYSNCVSSNIFKDKAKQLNAIESRVNTDKSYILKVNIFKEKCGCEKCLSESFLFYSCQPVNLTNELLQVLKSEHCSNWNRYWIKIVIEQMLIFFSCIKNGIIYERLLEYACDCASMLVMKHSSTNLLEYKYSYKYFIEKLIADFQFISAKYNNNNNNNNNNNRIKDKSIYCGHEIGKVYFDLIENFAIMSFETENQMNAYTKYEKQIKKTRPHYFMNSFRKFINSCDNFIRKKRKIKTKVKKISCEKGGNSCVLLSKSSEDAVNDGESVQFDEKSMENPCESERETITLSSNHSCLQTTLTNGNISNKENTMDLNNWRGNNETVHYRIPVMHGCSRRNSNLVQCSCKSFSLGMILNLGNNRALPKQTIENLKLLEKNETSVTSRLATIAASALQQDGQATVKRIIVPVVLSDIVNQVKDLQWPRVDNSREILKDVEFVMNALLDQVCCLNESLESINKIDETDSSDQKQKKNNISSRLNERSTKREIKMSSRFINSVFFDEASLPLATSVFQGSRSLGTQRRMEFVCDERKKRKVKALIGDDECTMKGTHDDVCKKRKSDLINNDLCKRQKMDIIIDAWKKRGSSTVLRKLDFSVGNIDEKKTLADILIWCAYHDKYNCPCILSVCKMKHNLVIWEPPKILKYVTHKVMSKIDNIRHKASSCQVYFFDSEEYCARSYGAPMNYSLRNNSELFSAKRRYEIENNVITSTNSFIKFKYTVFKNGENEIGTDEEYGDVIKYKCKENVNIVAENDDEDIEIDIGEYSRLEDIIVISDNEEDHATGINNSVEKPVNLNKQKPEVRTYLWSNDKSSTPKTYLKTKRKPQTDNNLDGNLIRNSNVEKNTDGKILESNMADINTPSPIKPLKTYLFQLQQNSIDITNYDPTLENGLLWLKDHPLKDEIYCENKLPKLALYCITPGIGYLPIVEYTTKALVVFDPIFPEVLHSFKNLTTANMWLNKFLKDFLVSESINISLKWIIVKPGIIKMKQSQPFSPAIFENSLIIISKDGEIRFSKKELRQEICEYKRKQITDQVVDINGSDGKRKKIHLDSLNQIGAKILTRTVNLVQQYPSKKSTLQLQSATAVNSVYTDSTQPQVYNQNITTQHNKITFLH